MTTRSNPGKEISPQDRELLKAVEGYLTEEGYRFHFLADDCIEMYLQGKNLTMRMLIYAHNRHLVVRVPSFIRNVEMRRAGFLLELMNLMNEFFDIRFELSADGRSLSGASNHIVEDGRLSKGQFTQAMMVVAYMVDEQYPRLLKILYGQGAIPGSGPESDGIEAPPEEPTGPAIEETGSEPEEPLGEPPDEDPSKKPKIN